MIKKILLVVLYFPIPKTTAEKKSSLQHDACLVRRALPKQKTKNAATHSHLQRMKTACLPCRSIGNACAHDDRKSAPPRTCRRRRQTFNTRKRQVAVPVPPRVFQGKQKRKAFSPAQDSQKERRDEGDTGAPSCTGISIKR